MALFTAPHCAGSDEEIDLGPASSADASTAMEPGDPEGTEAEAYSAWPAEAHTLPAHPHTSPSEQHSAATTDAAVSLPHEPAEAAQPASPGPARTADPVQAVPGLGLAAVEAAAPAPASAAAAPAPPGSTGHWLEAVPFPIAGLDTSMHPVERAAFPTEQGPWTQPVPASGPLASEPALSPPVSPPVSPSRGASPARAPSPRRGPPVEQGRHGRAPVSAEDRAAQRRTPDSSEAGRALHVSQPVCLALLI